MRNRIDNPTSETVLNGLYLRLDGANVPSANYVWTTDLTVGTLTATQVRTDAYLTNNGTAFLSFDSGLSEIEVWQDMDMQGADIQAGGDATFTGSINCDDYNAANGTDLLTYNAAYIVSSQHIVPGAPISLGLNGSPWTNIWGTTGDFGGTVTVVTLTDGTTTLTGGNVTTTGNITIDADDSALFVGASQDASISFTATGLILNADLVAPIGTYIGATGTGILYAGQTTLTGTLTLNGDLSMSAYDIEFTDLSLESTGTGGILLTSVGQTYNNTLTIDLDSQWYRAVITGGLSTGGVAGNAISMASAILFADNIEMIFGNASDFRMRWATTGNDHARFAFSGASGAGNSQNLLITGQYDSYSHAVSVDPTLFIHSKTVEETAINQWIGFWHDKTDGNIQVGVGDLNLIPATAVTLGDGGTTNYTLFESDGAPIYIGTAGIPYGEINVSGNAVATALTEDTPAQITVFDTNGPSKNTTPDHTSDDITILKAGHYMINIAMTINSSGGTGALIEVTCRKNSGAAEIITHMDRTLAGGGGESGAISLSGIADLAVSDTVEVWLENETNDDDVVVEDCSLSLFQLGGT